MHLFRDLDWSVLIDRVYPPVCLLCGTRKKVTSDLCRFCRLDLPSNISACELCALPLAASPGEQRLKRICGACLKKPPPFASLISVFHYREPVVWMLHQLKFAQKLIYARVLGQIMADRLRDVVPMPQCIVPVPLHGRRLRERGFNQALELSRCISKDLCIPIELNLCSRSKHTSAQTGLGAKNRRSNVRGVFQIDSPVSYSHIVIVDDVVTTMSTVSELAKLFQRAGVKRIDVWCLARA